MTGPARRPPPSLLSMRYFFLLPVLLLLASCAPRTEAVYDPPSLAWGGAGVSSCVEQCDIQRVRCGQDSAAALGACRSADGAIAAGFNGCRPGAPGCVAAPVCLADTSSCTAQYNACYNGCGGLVRTIRTPYFNADAMPTTPFIVPPLPGVGGAVTPRRATRTGMPTASRDGFVRDEAGAERLVPGQPIRLRRAPASEPY